MSKGNTHENAMLDLLFNAVTFDGIAENDTTSPNTSLYVSLHTADPGEAGTQATNEAAYGSYARVGVTRNAGGWTVSGNQVQNTALVQFPECSSGSETITHFGVGLLSSGAGTLLYKGALAASRAISTGIQPQFAAAAITITED